MRKELSEETKTALRAQKALKEYKERLNTVQKIMNATGVGLNRACDIFIARKYPQGNVPDDVLADLSGIRSELSIHSSQKSYEGRGAV